MSDEGDRLPILLFGLFLELVDNGVPIGVRDYLDGLRALQLGFGQGNFKNLHNLVQTLWARSEEERRLIARWFGAIPQPSQIIAKQLDQKLSEIYFIQNTRESREPEQTNRRHIASAKFDETNERVSFGSTREGEELNKSPDQINRPDVESIEINATNVRVSFGSSRERKGEGLTLPRLLASPAIEEKYVLFPQTLVCSRDMAVLWRRYRRTTRRGTRTELDIAGTVRDRCRKGLLLQPLYRARRSNSARLLILADASPSMTPWLPFLATLDDSLQYARFASAEMRYFINLPGMLLYTNPDLVDSELRDDVLRRFTGASLLVISDGGSARGYLNRRRAMHTSEFLSEATRIFGAIVWINPMPRPRWVNTTADIIARDPRATTLPLDRDHLLRAIDILRGNK